MSLLRRLPQDPPETKKLYDERARSVKQAERAAREQPTYPHLFDDHRSADERQREGTQPCNLKHERTKSCNHVYADSSRASALPSIALTVRDIDAVQMEVYDVLLRNFPDMSYPQAAGYAMALREILTNGNLRSEQTARMSTPAMKNGVDSACDCQCGMSTGHAGAARHRSPVPLHRVAHVPDLRGVYHDEADGGLR